MQGDHAGGAAGELRRSALQLVAEAALARGAEVVLAANDVVSDELDDRVLDLAKQAVRA